MSNWEFVGSHNEGVRHVLDRSVRDGVITHPPSTLTDSHQVRECLLNTADQVQKSALPLNERNHVAAWRRRCEHATDDQVWAEYQATRHQ